MTELCIKNLSKSFNNNKILKDVTFKLSDNKIYGLLGRNGAGKSTLLNCVCDRVLPNEGEIHLNNSTIHENEEALHQIYLMNDSSSMYYGWEKITDLYRYTDIAYGNFNYVKAHQLSQKFHVDENQKFKNLSTGLQTAVKLILSFCVNANIIFLDEPTLGLDASLRNTFYQEIIKTYNDRPRIFVLATHLINEVQNIIEEALILNNKTIFEDSVENIQKMVVQLKGPKEDILDLTGNDILNASNLGQELIAYVKTDLLSNVTVPATVDIQPVDLQTAFIVLTEHENKEAKGC